MFRQLCVIVILLAININDRFSVNCADVDFCKPNFIDNLFGSFVKCEGNKFGIFAAQIKSCDKETDAKIAKCVQCTKDPKECKLNIICIKNTFNLLKDLFTFNGEAFKMLKSKCKCCSDDYKKLLNIVIKGCDDPKIKGNVKIISENLKQTEVGKECWKYV